jgi:hypothetical protein
LVKWTNCLYIWIRPGASPGIGLPAALHRPGSVPERKGETGRSIRAPRDGITGGRELPEEEMAERDHDAHSRDFERPWRPAATGAQSPADC